MNISIVVAASENNVIGDRGGLPWHLPEDLRRFKEITLGKPIVMGRATWDSIGRALPGRRNLVISRNAGFEPQGGERVGSVEDAVRIAGDRDELMVIGGGQIYEQFLPLADRIYLTRVRANIEGDTLFPELDFDEWHEASRESFPKNSARDYAFDIILLERRDPRPDAD